MGGFRSTRERKIIKLPRREFRDRISFSIDDFFGMIDESGRRGEGSVGVKGSMEIEERKINIQTNNGTFELIKDKLVDDESGPGGKLRRIKNKYSLV